MFLGLTWKSTWCFLSSGEHGLQHSFASFSLSFLMHHGAWHKYGLCKLLFQYFPKFSNYYPLIKLEFEIANKPLFCSKFVPFASSKGTEADYKYLLWSLRYHLDIHCALTYTNILFLGEGKDMWKGNGNNDWCNAWRNPNSLPTTQAVLLPLLVQWSYQGWFIFLKSQVINKFELFFSYLTILFFL